MKRTNSGIRGCGDSLVGKSTCYLYGCMGTTCIHAAGGGGQKRALNPREPELQKVVSYRVGAGN